MVFKFDLKVSGSQLPGLICLLESISADERLHTSADGGIQRTPDGPEDVARIKDLIVFGQLPTGETHLFLTNFIGGIFFLEIEMSIAPFHP